MVLLNRIEQEEHREKLYKLHNSSTYYVTTRWWVPLDLSLYYSCRRTYGKRTARVAFSSH